MGDSVFWDHVHLKPSFNYEVAKGLGEFLANYNLLGLDSYLSTTINTTEISLNSFTITERLELYENLFVIYNLLMQYDKIEQLYQIVLNEKDSELIKTAEKIKYFLEASIEYRKLVNQLRYNLPPSNLSKLEVEQIVNSFFNLNKELIFSRLPSNKDLELEIKKCEETKSIEYFLGNN